MEQRFGAHTIRADDGIAYITLIGDVTLEDVQQMLPLMESVITNYGYYGALIDARRFGSIVPTARRMVGQWPGTVHCVGNAVIGAGLATRTLFTLIARAIQLFTAAPFKVAFLRSESDALRWLGSRRPVAHASKLS